MLLFDSSDNYEEEEEKEEVDRISLLPDAVIHNILRLSSIDTKDVVQTCMFSKKWINVWKSLPYLNFDMGDNTLDKANDKIERVLLLRDDCDIQSFNLRGKWYYFHDYVSLSLNLSRYIDTIVKRNIQEVTLELYQAHADFKYKIPHNLFNCKSLEKFRLVSSDTSVHILLPESMSLPHLKTLYLGGFMLSNLESLTRLFSSCPVLRTLGVGNCNEQTAKWMIKCLVADAKVEKLDLYPGFLEVLHESVDLVTCHGLPCLPNLQSLRLETWLNGGTLCSIDYLLKISPNINTLILKLKRSKQWNTSFDWKAAGILLPRILPHLKFVRIEEMEGSDAELKILRFLLNNANILEEVTLFYRFNVSLPERAREVKQFRDKVRAFPKASSNIKIRLK